MRNLLHEYKNSIQKVELIKNDLQGQEFSYDGMYAILIDLRELAGDIECAIYIENEAQEGGHLILTLEELLEQL